MTDVTIRYYAGARAAAGVDSDAVRDVASVSDALDRAATLRTELKRVLPSCSYLLNGVAVRDPLTALPDSATLDVLPPFAGG
jgi:molybdopterin converting factor small subunit